MLTFGKESFIFHVTILTFKKFRGGDTLLWEDVVESLRAVDPGMRVGGNKAWSLSRRVNASARDSLRKSPKS